MAGATRIETPGIKVRQPKSNRASIEKAESQSENIGSGVLYGELLRNGEVLEKKPWDGQFQKRRREREVDGESPGPR